MAGLNCGEWQYNKRNVTVYFTVATTAAIGGIVFTASCNLDNTGPYSFHPSKYPNVWTRTESNRNFVLYSIRSYSRCSITKVNPNTKAWQEIFIETLSLFSNMSLQCPFLFDCHHKVPLNMISDTCPPYSCYMNATRPHSNQLFTSLTPFFYSSVKALATTRVSSVKFFTVYCKSTNFGVLLYLAKLANCVFSLIFVAAKIYVDRTLHRRASGRRQI